MNIIICGAGRVGYGIARKLSLENNAVTVVDQSVEAVQAISTDLDVRGIVGHGSHPSVLEAAGIDKADMLIAVTYSDEVNMVACQIAHSLYSTPLKIARVRAQDYLNPKWRHLYDEQNMPIDTIISPEIEIGKAVMRRVNTPGAFDVVPFADGMVQVIGVTLTAESPVINTPIQQMEDLFPDIHAQVIGIRRDADVFAPTPEDILSQGDDVYFLVPTENTDRLMKVLGLQKKASRHSVIIGGGNIGCYIAKQLDAVPGSRVRVIEADKVKAEHAAETLKNTVVLNGNALQSDVLIEAGVRDAQAVVCVTNDDKTNILSGVVAKSMGAGQIFALINELPFREVKTSLDIDMIIDPRMITVSSILRHVRKGRIHDVFAIDNGAAEIIEGEVLETSPLTGKTIKDIDLMEGVTFGALIRDESVFDAKPDTVIKNHDRIIVLAERDETSEVESLFRVGVDYF